ncbi:hypothetical protein MPSEU_000286300 [Mayamaea pseudoterrestris]|nr:hypothetical protein MPSEU_000286300 [Mayamaea pseudoterrestris]
MLQPVQHLIGPTCFPAPPSSDVAAAAWHVSVLSYNVLLPNSIDGWWNYKMYSPPLSEEQLHISQWGHRRDLLQQRMQTINADVVCLQEVAPVSFQDDFRFMTELGYDCEMFKRGRFRPATFWKRDKLELVSPPVHKDRTLLTAFQVKESLAAAINEDETTRQTKQCDKTLYVLNCHLQAGKEGKRRVRQLIEGIGAVVNLAKKRREEKPENIPVIVCGDFNGGLECGAVRLLEDRKLDETFLEDGEPVVSSRKELRLEQPLVDVMATVTHREPPATLVVSELISTMVESGDGTSYENPKLSVSMLERLRRIHDRMATTVSPLGEKVMSVEDVEGWLIKINGQLGRGSEFREAAKQMGWKDDGKSDGKGGSDAAKDRIKLPQDGVLNYDGFVNVYQAELRQGKFWGIAYDMAVLGEPLPDVGLFQSRYDRMYCSAVVKPYAVMDFLCDAPCPNKDEPSDHLPIAASFSISP